ncbi:MAG: response regulator [Rhodospirillaceae bacterium]|nr:response regulator [Rhodospirillaceae bacterium]MBT3928615.1 response regulator [Rhodospirillaceae bacterium]MBT4427304.1 response regulator [Rhodospirillaceae bacterium]MBT5037817.1 response regulator [Rhodospirillaceae bacterium]MBT5676398.1 response regulator [Rhodospirillaceae bacterium]
MARRDITDRPSPPRDLNREGARDVTDSQIVEEALRASESRLRHAQKVAHIGLFERHMESGQLKWSDELFRILGLDPASDIASIDTLMARVHPEDKERVGAVIQEELAGEIIPNLEYRIVRPNGQIRHISERYEAETISAGQSTIIEGILQDVTDRKMLEQQFRQNQNIEAIDSLTGNVAHEFNNLLFVILGNLDLLEDCVPQDGDILQLIEAARRGAVRGADLTERLLAFSRKQHLEPEQLYLNYLIPDSVPLLQAAVSEMAAVKTRISDTLWPVFADRSQIDNTLLHLAVNARDALPNGGSITIIAENAVIDEQEAANLLDVAAGDYVRLSVRDEGIGMSAELIENAVTPFFTTKEVGKGTGLGLSMVFGFAQQSGGFAKIDSQVGKGTTVALYLPKATEQNLPGKVARAGPPKKSILLVEDEAEVRYLVAKLLRELGYHVIEAGDGRAAQAVLEGNERIDLLFSDIAMPHGLNGPQVAEIGLRLRPGLKLLFMSGYREEYLADSGQVMEGVPIIWKPYDKEEMAQMVAGMLKESIEQ